MESPNPEPPTSQPATDDPRSRTAPAPKRSHDKSAPATRAANLTLAPTRAAKTQIYWHSDATKKYRKLRAQTPDLPTAAQLKAAIKDALAQTFGAQAPNVLNNPPLHPSLRAEIERRQKYDFELQIGIFDDDSVQQLNAEHRGKDKPTDVLSFSPWEGVAFPSPPDEPTIMLGDIIISIETAIRQAAELKHDLRAELAFLAVHGALHLLGYDHGTDSERRKMFALQDEIVARVREEKQF